MEGLGNLPALISIVDSQQPHIISLQETLLRSYDNVKIADPLRQYTWMFKNPDTVMNVEDLLTRRSLSFHGVALGISTDLAEKTTEVQTGCGNTQAVIIKTNIDEILVFNLYLPTRGKDDEFEDTLDAVTATIKAHPAVTKILLMGDLNVDSKSTRRRLNLWFNFIDSNNLEDNITDHITHHHHPTGVRNELDRFVDRNVDLCIELVNEPLSRSDHTPVLATMKLEVLPEAAAVKGDPIESRVKIDLLNQNIEEFRKLTEALAEDFERERGNYCLDTQNGLISTGIFRAAIHVTGQPQFQSQKERAPRKTRIPPHLLRLLRQARKSHGNQHTKSRRTPTGRRLSAIRMEIKNYLRSKQSQREATLHMRITEAARTNDSKLLSILKNIKQVNVVQNKLPTSIEGYGQKFIVPDVLPGITELFRLQTTMDTNPRFHEDRLDLARDVIWARKGMEWSEEEYKPIKFTEDSFNKIIDGLKKGKAQDYLGVSNDLLKALGPKMRALLMRISQESLDKRDIGGLVRNYGKGTIIIKKWGMRPNLIKSWRKIVVNNTILNLIQIRVQPGIEKKIQKEQTDSQMGFTEGIPVTNAVIARQELQNLSRRMKKTLFLGVLDLQSCFPRICREQALLLASDVLDPSEWDILCQIYQETWGELRVEAQKSKPVPGDIGTIEGGILSVQVLKIYISTLLVMLRRSGFDGRVKFSRIPTLNAGAIGVADDILLYSWCPVVMKQMLSLCQYWSDAYRATFSPDKSVIVIQRTAGDKRKYSGFMMNGEELRIVPRAEHLGVEILDDGENSEAHFETRSGKGRRAIMGNLSLYSPTSFINTATKLELWRKKFRSVVLYAQDTTNMKASTMKKLEDFQTKMLKGTMGLSSRASNIKTRLLAGVTSMTTEVWKNRLGALNNILLGTTMVRPICALAWDLRMEGTWTYDTVLKLEKILHDEDLEDKLQAADLLSQSRPSFKTASKNILHGAELRKIMKELTQSDIFRPHSNIFGTVMPMVNSDFSSMAKEFTKAYCQAYTGDFYRNFSGDRRCYLCSHKQIHPRDEKYYEDDTRHLLSNACIIAENPEVQLKEAEFYMLLVTASPLHIVTSPMVNEDFRVRFLMNPMCLSLGQHALSPSVVQYSGIDIAIKKIFYTRLRVKYEKLKQRGFIVKRDY